MKKPIHIACTAGLTILLTGVIAYNGFAGTSKQETRKGSGSVAPLQGKNTVILSGKISGSFQGRIRVDDRVVVVTKETRIYKADAGLRDHNILAVDTPVYIIGYNHNGETHARLVIVSDRKGLLMKGSVGLLGANDPQ